MKKHVFLLLILAAISCSLSARTIRGTVTNATNNDPIPGVTVTVENTSVSTTTDSNGKYTIKASEGNVLVFTITGMQTKKVRVEEEAIIDVAMKPAANNLNAPQEELFIRDASSSHPGNNKGIQVRATGYHKGHHPGYRRHPWGSFNREGYAAIHENDFKDAMKNPLSTFSIDVDAASYSNVRRFLTNGQKPPKDAVRIEEMINYFNYDYPEPTNGHPFSINQEMGRCPWNDENLLLHLGLQGERIETDNLPPSNLVFLIDVSGSMRSPNKLPLLKRAFKLLVNQMRAKDRVAIVVYAGSSGLVLSSTPGDQKEKILCSIEKLHAGGSTAGGAGLKLAYQVASENFVKEGNNRIILATDGDFNVGPSSNAAMERLIEEKRNQGIFISVLGFGTGNYQDSKMEIIADKGNGNYSYIDNFLEAKKVLVNEFGGTLYTIAKDVKIQIEFNPAVVESYRLIGYENRLLDDEDFDNDRKDAGELGSGHTVTALYEIVPAGEKSPKENTLRYQSSRLNNRADQGDEVARVKFRYKEPEGAESKLLEEIIPYEDSNPDEMSDNFRFSAAVAGFGMLLRDSQYKGSATYEDIISLAGESRGEDPEGYRSELIRLMKVARGL